MLRLRSTLAGGSIAILLLAGCATDAPAPVAEPPSTTPSSTPVETPVVTAAPDTLTPFSCDDLVPTAALVGTAAASLVFSPQPEARFDNAVRRQDGRMFCAWTGIDIRLYVQVSRGGRELIQEYDLLGSPYADEENTLGPGESALLCGEEGEPIGCSFMAVTDGYVMRGSLSGKKADLSRVERIALTRKIGSMAVASISVDPPPALWEPPAGSWPLVADCEAIFAAGTARMLGNEASLAFRASGADSPAPAEHIDAIGGSTLCWWNNKDDSRVPGAVSHVALQTLAGGAWYWDDETDYPVTVEVVDVAGADDAALRCTDFGCSLDGRMGNNAFSFSGLVDGSYSESMSKAQLLAAAPVLVEGLRAWWQAAG
ncbi:hypothetical protein EYE40_00385 [Glaciihabitans arcticus]|uniref:DUF3558 domain-containing protein n=1 Tax=Glaciihabitans arcticus TaxID=2668039 RepID=A0A4Q9GMQ4_9MICO|nr:hypothetical protein [Glaciihabitans arcticus]TBN55976.1 hypothetical protein EYE40_00385 [Glaciihabitans arcticus]